MVNITLSVSEELKKEMDKEKIINWSAVARQAIEQRLNMLKQFKAFTRDSTLTEEDALRMGREVSEKAMKKHKKWN